MGHVPVGCRVLFNLKDTMMSKVVEMMDSDVAELVQEVLGKGPRPWLKLLTYMDREAREMLDPYSGVLSPCHRKLSESEWAKVIEYSRIYALADGALRVRTCISYWGSVVGACSNDPRALLKSINVPYFGFDAVKTIPDIGKLYALHKKCTRLAGIGTQLRKTVSGREILKLSQYAESPEITDIELGVAQGQSAYLCLWIAEKLRVETVPAPSLVRESKTVGQGEMYVEDTERHTLIRGLVTYISHERQCELTVEEERQLSRNLTSSLESYIEDNAASA